MAKKRPANKLTTNDLVYLFEATPMTIYNWRKGSARKTRPLPAEIDPGGGVSFGIVATRKWAKENGLELQEDPADYLARRATKLVVKRPGPKPKVGEEKPSKGTKERITKAPGDKPKASSKAIGKALHGLAGARY